MYVSNYNPIQSSQSNFGMQGWQGSGFGFPAQQSYSSGPVINPFYSGSLNAFPYNVVSYGFSPAWQSGSFLPHYGGFTPGRSGGISGDHQLSGGMSHAYSGGYGIGLSPGIVQPSIELAETNTDLVLTCELPNVNPADVNLTVTDDSLSISTVAHSGGFMTPIHRTVCLPTSVKSEQVSASLSNGILEARLPKSDISARRRIKVNPSI